jgi:Carboxypeptidase regulatory-like domain
MKFPPLHSSAHHAMKTHLVASLSVLLALALALVSLALAETAYTETSAITVDTRGLWLGNVEIMVMDGTTGNMIPGVLVTAASQNQTTNSGGMARFNNLAAGDYTFSVVKSGYISTDVKKTVVAGVTRVYTVPLYAGTSVDMAQIPFAGAQAIEDIAADGSKRIKVITHYRLNGTAPDYTVSLRYRRGGSGAWTAIAPAKLAHYGGSAPDFGAGVKPGTHSVAWDVATDLPNMHEPMLQVEITATRSGRTAVKETSFITVDTRGQTLGTLSGRIVATGATPLAGATVLLMPHNKTVTTGADGTFSLSGLVPGTGGNLRVSATGYQPFLKNPLTVPTNSLNLGDLTLAAEVQVMRLRPLQPNPNPPTLKVPVGGTGYLYYQLMTADGKLSCPGQPVVLETTGGSAIPQSITPHENWAGPIAGLSDKDGIVRLEVPASAIGGVAGALANVRVRTTATIIPDTSNFPTGSNGSAFVVVVEVVPREWEQVRTLVAEKKVEAGIVLDAIPINASVKRALNDVAEHRLYYAGSQLTGENISTRTTETVGADLDLKIGKTFRELQATPHIGVGVDANVGLSMQSDYYFPAPGGSVLNPPLGNAFKSYHVLRSHLLSAVPVIGTAVLDRMNSAVWPNFRDYHAESQVGLVGSLGTETSLNLDLGGAIGKTYVNLRGSRAFDGSVTEEGLVGAPTGNGQDRKTDEYVWTGVRADSNSRSSADTQFLRWGDSMTVPLSDTKYPESIDGLESNRSLGMRYYPGYWGKAKRADFVNIREFTDRGTNVDFRQNFGLHVFPSSEAITSSGETRRFYTTRTVERRNGGEFGQFDSMRWVSNEVYDLWQRVIGGLSIQEDYQVTYERGLAVGKASSDLKIPINFGVAKFTFGGKTVNESDSVVERGLIWRNREFPRWTLPAPVKSEIPTTSMLTVLKDWTLVGGDELIDLTKDEVKETVSSIVSGGVNVTVKVLKKAASILPFQSFSSSRSPRSPGDPTYAPAPPEPTSDGWENYGISGLYELTSDTPITTAVPLVISYNIVDLGGGNAADLAAYYFVPETASWQLVESTLDETAQTVTVDATRTGYYGLALPRPAGVIQLVLDAEPPLLADGATTATVRASGLLLNNGAPVPDGTLYTVNSNGLIIEGVDASSSDEGFQVVSTNALLSFTVRTPAGGLTSSIEAASVGGEAKGTLEIALRDTTAPPVPDDVILTGASSSLRAAWDPSSASDVVGYRVYYKLGMAGPPWDGVANLEGSASPVFTDESLVDLTGLTAGQTYYVAVSAVDEAGNESALSVPASILLQASPPTAPTAGMVVKGATGQVFLSWALSSDDLLGQRNVDHYEVRRRLPGGAWTAIGTAASGQNTYGDTWPAGLAANQYPEYSIVAMPASGPAGEAGGMVFDSDSDTLPDPWETAVGLDPFNPADATENGDGDLRNNLEEYLAGSFPGVSDGTAFEITQLATETTTNGSRLADVSTVRLSWNTALALAAGESYVVEATPTVGSPNWQLVANAVIILVNRTGVAMVPVVEGAPALTYRINISAGPDGYRSWIAQSYPGSTDANLIGGTVDPDHDGIPNAVEMVLGGSPASANDSAFMPTLAFTTADLGAGTTDYFVFTYRRTGRAVAAGLISEVQYSPNLDDTWITAAENEPGVKVLADPNFHGAGIDRVRVHIPRAGKPKLFGRLRVLVP